MRQQKQHPNKEARRENMTVRRIAMIYHIPVKSIGLWPNKGYTDYFEARLTLQNNTYQKIIMPALNNVVKMMTRDDIIAL